jgi:hypothetical protein
MLAVLAWLVDAKTDDHLRVRARRQLEAVRVEGPGTAGC